MGELSFILECFRGCVCVCVCEIKILMNFLENIIFLIKDVCHGRNDAISVISVTNSNKLVHKMRIVKRFDFHYTKAIALSRSTKFPVA